MPGELVILMPVSNSSSPLSSSVPSFCFARSRRPRHSGITSVLGPQFRRVTLDNPERFGLFGKGAVLLKTSYGDRTSPVLRGAWVLDKLLGTPPTPPPPGVETNLSQTEGET